MRTMYAALITLCVAVSAYGMTLGEIRTQVRLHVDPSTVTSRQIWSDSMLDAWINLGHIDVIRRTKCLSVSRTVDTSSTTRFVQIPADAMTIDRVAYWDGASTSTLSYRAIPRTFRETLDVKLPSWDRPTYGVPQEWFVYGSSIGLNPIPSALYAGPGKLLIDYTVRVSTLSADGDEPYNGLPTLWPYRQLLVWYTCWMAYQTIGDLNSAAYYRKLYYDSLAIMGVELKDYSGWQPKVRME